MGTQNAWGGSGGRDWGRVRNESNTLIDDPSSGNVEALLPSLGDALDWLDDAPGDGSPDTTQPTDEVEPPQAPLPTGPSWSS
ncbi:MAG: hypothetical protein M3O70_26295, partial [Actinomycetota bacterium]|nr:hypothetical protein [Actinomycetota bacterium]